MTARLVGGPHDGDSGQLIVDPPPATIWVIECPDPHCPDGTHWYASPVEGAFRYALVALDGQGARYEYGEHFNGASLVRTREKEPVAA